MRPAIPFAYAASVIDDERQPSAGPSAHTPTFRPRPVILDCDPGHDDALAIALALASPELSILGITTVAGNAPRGRTTRNALRVLALLGRPEVPVASGADQPLMRASWIPLDFHGESGLDGAALPEPAGEPVAQSALEFMASIIRASADPVTLVATAPLTNIGLLLRAVPELHARIGSIALMGGSMGEGNTTASAEFNIWQDPEAAAIVFGAGIPILMAGLDVSHQALVLPADIARMDAIDNRTGAVFADLMRFFAGHHRDRYGWDGPPAHDAVAVAMLVRPALIERVPMRIDIETGDGPARGRTVADPEGIGGLPTNVEIGVRLDRPGFIDLIVDALATFP